MESQTELKLPMKKPLTYVRESDLELAERNGYTGLIGVKADDPKFKSLDEMEAALPGNIPALQLCPIYLGKKEK